jgi:hypothetical protein
MPNFGYAEIIYKLGSGETKLKVIENFRMPTRLDNEPVDRYKARVNRYVLSLCSDYIKENYTNLQWKGDGGYHNYY